MTRDGIALNLRRALIDPMRFCAAVGSGDSVIFEIASSTINLQRVCFNAKRWALLNQRESPSNLVIFLCKFVLDVIPR